jgi:RHS repeat-associated protein
LGSNVITANKNGSIVQSNHYYPFGLTMAISTGPGVQPYKYTGKELDMQHGLNLYDFSARTYDPAIGRFTTVDPLAEKYYPISPYAYCLNNPVMYVDRDGRDIRIANNTAGALLNLAKIAATSYGQIVLDRLINSRRIYTAESVFLSKSSKYENQTINYVRDTWLSRMDGGYASNELFMGHEIYHAYQDDNFHIAWGKDGIVKNLLQMEREAVSFENYIRDVYGLSPKRLEYKGLAGGEKDKFFPFSFRENEESVSNFTSLGNNKDKTHFGFSFDKKTSKSEIQKHYIVVSSNENKSFDYQIYTSEDEYKKITSNW